MEGENVRRRYSAAVALAALATSRAAMAQSFFIGRNVTGATLGVDSGFIPPDTMGTVGVDFYVELVNGRYSVYRKSDGVKVQTSSLNSFFTTAGASTSTSFDPRVLYDPFSKRFFAAAADNSNSASSSYLLAVSNSSDPTAGWHAFRIDG